MFQFQFILSLEYQSLVKVADMLWSEDIMDRAIRECRKLYYQENPSCPVITHKIEKIIVDTIWRVVVVKFPVNSFPNTLGEKFLCIIKKVGVQKVNWYFYHEKFWSIKKLPRIFYWTSRGTIDRKKTSESLIMDNTIDICERYSLACCYCFEKEIYELGKEIPHRLRKLLTDYAFGSYTTYKDGRIVKYWNLIIEYGRLKNNQRNETNLSDVHQVARDHCLQETDIKMKKIYKRAYKYALDTANNIAAEYFWGKLLEIEHGRVVKLHRLLDKKMGICTNLPYDDWEVFRPKEFYIDTAFSLLRQTTKNQQFKAMGINPVETIQLFLSWPFHVLFSQAVKYFFFHMSVDNSVRVLDTILCSRDRRMYKVFNHRDLYTEFWQEFSVSQKLHIINRLLRNSHLFSSLVINKHYEVLILLNNLTATQKEQFLLSKSGLKICEEVADDEIWSSLKLFFEAALSSVPRIVVTKFKKKLKYFLANRKIVDASKVFDILRECEKRHFKGFKPLSSLRNRNVLYF